MTTPRAGIGSSRANHCAQAGAIVSSIPSEAAKRAPEKRARVARTDAVAAIIIGCPVCIMAAESHPRLRRSYGAAANSAPPGPTGNRDETVHRLHLRCERRDQSHQDFARADGLA